MKWGNFLQQEMLWQWRDHYINYKRLKHIIRQLKSLNPQIQIQSDDVKLYEQYSKDFFTFINTDMETVERFYCEKQAKLIEQASTVMEMFDPISHSDSPRQKRNVAGYLSILRGLTNLLPFFQQLQRYAQLNQEGFRKILKKWDKHIRNSAISTEDYLVKLRTQTFFEGTKLNKFIENMQSNIVWYRSALEGHGEVNTCNKSSSTSPISTVDTNTLLDSFRISQKTPGGISSLSGIINFRGANGNTLLMYACAAGAHDIAEILIQSGCDIHAVNAYGRNAVHVCAQAGHVDCLQLLLKKGVKCDEVDVDHCNPLHLAVKNERYDICVALLEKDASLVDSPDCDGQSPLMLSCWKHNSKIMNLCLEHTTNVNAVNWIGQNSLHYACKSNHSEGVAALLKYNIDVLQLDHHGLSPFHVAASSGHLKLLQQLMDHATSHADINNKEIISIKKSDICRKADDKGWTLLHHACANGDKTIVEYLLSIGADATITDSFGYCPHCIAVFTGKTPLYKLLTPCNPTYITAQPGAKSSDIEVNTMSNQAKTCVVRFQMECDETEGQDVYIIGNCTALGNWDVEKGIRMKPVIGTTTAAALDKIIATETPRNSLIKNEIGSGIRWVCNVDLPKNATIKYRYIIKISTKWEDISGDRAITVNESAVVDDGVFEKTIVNAVTTTLSKVATEEDGKDASSNGTRWRSNNWMDNDARLYLRLGHRTHIEKQNTPIIMCDDIEIAKIVVKSGFTEDNNFQGSCVQILLPLDDPLTEWKFQTKKEHIKSLCTLQFEFYPKFGPPVARGYVLPEQLLNSSIGALSIPLHAIGELSDRCAGKFYFEYLIAQPFEHPKCGAILNRSFPNEQVLIGHRGTGSWRSFFRPGPRRTHIKENTILAFNTAMAFGAQYVEFDVQLTRDKIPVIYHDFLFHCKEFTIPVNNVTLKQWKQYNKSLRKERKKLHRCNDLASLKPKKEIPTHRDHELPTLRAYMSLENPQKEERIEHKSSDSEDSTDPDNEKVATLEHGLDGLDWVKDDYCTLEEAFQSVPSSVGFNVEIKYPNFDECVEDDICFIDLNEYLDHILEVIFNCAQDRKIIFSSFHPDICTLLMAKQPQYPVFFLTTGDPYYTDPRTTSWFSAVQFAKRSRMFGIVSSAVPCLAAPHLINSIHESALLLMTYGDANNDTLSVNIQRQRGINGIITDHVQHVQSHIQTKSIAKML